MTYIHVLYSRKELIRIKNYVKQLRSLTKTANLPGRILRICSRICKMKNIEDYIREKQQETHGAILVAVKMCNMAGNLPYENKIDGKTWFTIEPFFGKDTDNK